jgi:hypothetical protein
MILTDFLEAAKYNISNGDEFLWKCFGDNVHVVECTKNKTMYNSGASCYFNKDTQDVYMVEIFTKDDKWYRWIKAEYISVYEKECDIRNIDFEIANQDTGTKWIELDVLDDVYRKVSQVIDAQTCDNEVSISLNLDNETFIKLSMAAHVKGITLNQFMNDVLKEMIETYK